MGNYYDTKYAGGTVPYDEYNDLTTAARRGGASTRVATFVIAASDSPSTLGADYVCTGTADDVTINAAIEALPASGGTIYLLEGTYDITDDIDMDSYTTVRGAGWQTVLKVSSSISATTHVFSIDGSEHTEVSDLFIDGNDTSGHGQTVRGVWIDEGSSYIVLRNLKIMRCYDGISGDEYGWIEWVDISGCHIEDISDDGLDLNYFTHTRVVNNTITDIGDNGIDTERLAYSLIADNIVTDCGGHGIELESEVYYSCYNCVISGNVIDTVGGNGIEANSGQYTTICGNFIYSVTGHGLYIGALAYVGTDDQKFGGRLTIVGNQFRSIGGDGIKEESGEVYASVIVGNSFYNVTGTVLNLDSSAGTEAWNNLGADDVGTKKKIIYDDASELTIASGVITVTQTYHDVDTESDGASDDLDTINGGVAGQLLILRAEHTDRTVVLKNGTGNIKSGADITLDSTDDTATLIYDGTNWLLISSSSNS